MKVLHNFNEIENTHTGIGLGNFDGMHLGHMALISSLVDYCKIKGLVSVIYTFENHPENILSKEASVPMLITNEKKAQILGTTNLDCIYFENFDDDYSMMTPESFVEDILVNKFRARLVVVGFNYRFGYKGQGDTEILEKTGAQYGIKTIVIPPVTVDGNVISSTLIRELVRKGHMENVMKYLGRNYSVRGKVCKGRKMGSTLGFPTANISPDKNLIIPDNGVYLTNTILNGITLPSITNIGRNPTVVDSGYYGIETHILNYNEDIYNKDIEVCFIKKLRDEKKYINQEALIIQVKNDIKKALKLHSI